MYARSDMPLKSALLLQDSIVYAAVALTECVCFRGLPLNPYDETLVEHLRPDPPKKIKAPGHKPNHSLNPKL